MVDLLKRNHDTLLEKYELFRQRNQSLEKTAIEKENLYNEVRLASEKASSQVFSLQKKVEELLS